MHHAGVYIHIPFCRTRCSYCDFATGAYESGLADRYVTAVCAEVKSFRKQDPSSIEANTIYFGGGTPSLLSSDQVERILLAVHSRFRVTTNVEVTMEMNPGTVTLETLYEFRRLGVNRASFGAQTFDDDELRRLGRSHTADDVRTTIQLMREAGFDNTSFDLIAGLPGQTLDSWSRNLDEALALRPEHLSFYLLEVHQGTPLANQIARGQQPEPDDDVAAEMYQTMLDRSFEEGYEHYEISNLCQPGFESRHNSKYWTGAPVYGFGCSAHSYDGNRSRWSNERDVARYAELIETTGDATIETTELDDNDVRAESVFLGLRLMRGIDLREYRARFGADLRVQHALEIERLEDAGLIVFDEEIMRLTRHGVLLSNEVFSVFV